MEIINRTDEFWMEFFDPTDAYEDLYVDEKMIIKGIFVLYLDGTKFEANANKMTFVWKKAITKYRARCWEKTMKCIKSLNRNIKNDLELSMIFFSLS